MVELIRCKCKERNESTLEESLVLPAIQTPLEKDIEFDELGKNLKAKLRLIGKSKMEQKHIQFINSAYKAKVKRKLKV